MIFGLQNLRPPASEFPQKPVPPPGLAKKYSSPIISAIYWVCTSSVLTHNCFLATFLLLSNGNQEMKTHHNSLGTTRHRADLRTGATGRPRRSPITRFLIATFCAYELLETSVNDCKQTTAPRSNRYFLPISGCPSPNITCLAPSNFPGLGHRAHQATVRGAAALRDKVGASHARCANPYDL